MLEVTIPLIGWRIFKQLLKKKLSSLHKTLILLLLPRVNSCPIVPPPLHSKSNIYLQRKWKIDRQHKALCYNCDEKYVKGHYFHEQNLFHMDISFTPEIEYLGQEKPSEEETNEQHLQAPDIVTPSTSNKEAIISLHALFSIYTL